MNEGKCCVNSAPMAPICDKVPTLADNLAITLERLSDVDVMEERILSFLKKRNVGVDACKPEITCMMDQADYIAGQAMTAAEKLNLIGCLLGALQG